MDVKAKLAAFFDDDDTSFPQKSLDDQKLNHFALGSTRKSKRERETEAQEAKRKEEEDLTAKAYEDFLETFEGDGASRSREGPGFVKQGSGGSYGPRIRGRGAMNAQATEIEQIATSAPKPKGKRAMDTFLEEIKRDQAERESRLTKSSRAQGRSVTALAAYESQSGSKDRGDPETSNLFIANLPPTVSETSLGQFCAKIGPVASVKIMWPRSDASHGPGADMTHARRAKNSGLSGFVSFMTRKDAEAAVRELDGFEWGGHILRVGWSKAVPIGPRAMYSLEKRRSRSPQRSRSRDSSRSRSPRSRSRSRSRDRYRSHHRDRTPERHSRRRDDLDRESEMFIKMVASVVKERGTDFEEILKIREADNPKYTFLGDERSRSFRYYRSLVDSSDRVELPFGDDGYNSVYSTDSAEESERERGPRDRLGRLARRRFEQMLRGLTGRKGEIARCMAFSLEHAEAASEVSDIIVSSILIDDTPVPRKVARLHLICDILHNSAVSISNAWKFRQEFQSRLGLIFDHLSTIYHSFPGRITADSFKNQIIAVVDVWEGALVFPLEFTQNLRLRLEGVLMESVEEEVAEVEPERRDNERQHSFKFKSSGFKPANAPEEFNQNGAAGAAQGSSDGKDEMDTLDGEPLSDTDGEPMDDVDGEPMDDIDGEPMDDVDGVPMNDDVDGFPMNDADGDPM